MKKLLQKTIEEVNSSKKSKSLIFFNGNFHETGLFDHFRKYINVADGEFLDLLRDLEKQKEAVYEECEMLLDLNKHPEWHLYDMTRDDVETKATDAFYDRDGVRILIDDNMNVFFEGKTKGLELIKSYILYCSKHETINKVNVNHIKQ